MFFMRSGLISHFSPQEILNILKKRNDFSITSDHFFLDLFPYSNNIKLQQNGTAYLRFQKKFPPSRPWLKPKLILKIKSNEKGGSSLTMVIRSDYLVLYSLGLLFFGLIALLLQNRPVDDKNSIIIIAALLGFNLLLNFFSFLKAKGYFESFVQRNLL